MKSPLRYTGGKTRAVNQLLKLIPPNTKELISPFFGGGSFELACAEKGIKVYGYDTFEALTDFWFYVKNDPIILANKIQSYYHIDKSTLRTWSKKIWSETNRLERATMFFILNRTTFGGTTVNGGLYTDIYQRFTTSIIERIRKADMINVQVEMMDFRQVFAKHKTALMYLDPPYVGQDRLYAYSKTSNPKFPHEELAELLYHRDNWFMSYGDDPLIRKLYADYTIIIPNWSYGISKKKSKEIIILSPSMKVNIEVVSV